MTRSSAGRQGLLAGILLAIAGCSTGPTTPPLGPPTAAAALEVRAEWAPCHQMGACVYSAELVGPDGGSSTAGFDVQQGGLAVIGPGLPAELRDGEYRLTLVSMMLGDTIEPNGAQTVLGEDARCTTQFTVGPGALKVAVTGSFRPGLCAVSVSEAPNLTVEARPDRATLAIDGTHAGCNSLGGCAYLVRLAGPAGQSEATFIWAMQGDRLTPAAGLPYYLEPGDHVLAFESRLMSDVIVPGQDRAFSVDAACRTAFAVDGAAEVIVVHVAFRAGECLTSLERQPAP
jgi:hypothetical protein